VTNQQYVGLGSAAFNLERINVDHLPVLDSESIMPKPSQPHALILEQSRQHRASVPED
jgi:hypothetical protein